MTVYEHGARMERNPGLFHKHSLPGRAPLREGSCANAGGCQGLGSPAKRRQRAGGQNPDCASFHPGYACGSIRGRLAPRTIASVVHDPAKEEAMTSELNSSKPGAGEPFASRRGFVAAAVTMAA